MLEQIQTLLADFDLDAALAFLKVHSERQGTVARLAKTKNIGMIRYELELLLQNPKTYLDSTVEVRAFAAENTSPQAKAYATERNAQPPSPQAKAYVTENTDEYPEHYPDFLVTKLRQARDLIAEKRRISNSLYKDPKWNKKAEVDRILELADAIDEVYKVKESFDRSGRLPVEWLAQENITPEDMETADRQEILQKIKNINSNISKTNAKLHNPNECANGTPEIWRKKVREWELERAKLKLLIGM